MCFCYSSLELKYLEFLSSITKDILMRRSFSDAGIDVIIRSHVAANKHKLREVTTTTKHHFIIIFITLLMCVCYIFVAGCDVAEDSFIEEGTRLG